MSGGVIAALLPGEAVPGVDIAVTAVIGILLIVDVAQALHNHAVNQADQQADESLKEGDQAKPCIECGQMPCFEPPEGGDPEEMARQLKEQQDLINSQSPQDMQKRLDAAQARKNKTGSYRPPGDAADRAETRSDYQNDQITKRAEQLQANGDMDPEAAQAQASSEVAKQMKDLDATHQLDSIVGGDENDTMGMGDRSTNRSIGSQWKSRRADLEKAVKAQEAEGKEKMDVKLDVCK